MTRRDEGGYYCTDCGGTTRTVPIGEVHCPRCGHLGLRGYDRKPRRVACSEPDCTFTGWDDGGVNDDLGRHRRREHIADTSTESPRETSNE